MKNANEIDTDAAAGAVGSAVVPGFTAVFMVVSRDAAAEEAAAAPAAAAVSISFQFHFDFMFQTAVNFEVVLSRFSLTPPEFRG